MAFRFESCRKVESYSDRVCALAVQAAFMPPANAVAPLWAAVMSR